MDIIIGSHVGYKQDDQLLGSVKEALKYGCNTFMFYTGAPQNTNRKEIDPGLTKKAHELMRQNNIDSNNVVVHAPYIINLANPKNTDFGIRFLKEEIKRVETLGFNKIVLHPGSHVGIGIEEGLKNIIFCLNQIITKDTKVEILLETMAGKGTELGINFNELKTIIDNINYQDKIKVCLDTCHLNDAGYNLENFDNILKEFDQTIGIEKISCIHINDSKNVMGSHKDRHENIGLGKIGFENLINVIYHDKLKGIPKILETPYIPLEDNDKVKIYPPYKQEIEMIRSKKMNENLICDIRNYYK